jgi:hypothetical protein
MGYKQNMPPIVRCYGNIKFNEKSGGCLLAAGHTEILVQLGQSKYFSCLDMVKGFHQIELEEPDIEKTAFSTKMATGHSGDYHLG